MKVFSTTRTKRSPAFVALLVCLFALASGVANACLLELHDRHSNAVSASHSTAKWVGDNLDTSTESSLKCCDDGTIALTNGHSGVDQIDPGSAPLVTTLWAPSAHVVSVPRRLDDLQLHTVGPPLRVRYSRLAL